MRLPYGHCFQLDDSSLNAKPDKLPVAIAAFEHLIGSLSCHYRQPRIYVHGSEDWRLARCRDRGSKAPNGQHECTTGESCPRV